MTFTVLSCVLCLQNVLCYLMDVFLGCFFLVKGTKGILSCFFSVPLTGLTYHPIKQSFLVCNCDYWNVGCYD